MQAKIQELSERHGKFVVRDLAARHNVAQLETALEYGELLVLVPAYREGLINGKNARAREVQEAAIIAANPEIATLRAALTEAQAAGASVTGEMRALETEMKWTAAWLYSQARIG